MLSVVAFQSNNVQMLAMHTTHSASIRNHSKQAAKARTRACSALAPLTSPLDKALPLQAVTLLSKLGTSQARKRLAISEWAALPQTREALKVTVELVINRSSDGSNQRSSDPLRIKTN